MAAGADLLLVDDPPVSPRRNERHRSVAARSRRRARSDAGATDEDGAFDPSFAAILAQARQGEPWAFEQLYQLLHRRVLVFARVRGFADPEGLVNDVFLGVFQRLSTFEGSEAQFAAWVFRIARNKMIDDARRRGRRPNEVPTQAASMPSTPAPDDVEATALCNVETDSLVLHLDELTPDQRDVLLLRVVSDLTIEAIAEVMGKKTGAVKALQRRAFRSLARSLDDQADRDRPDPPTEGGVD